MRSLQRAGIHPDCEELTVGWDPPGLCGAYSGLGSTRTVRSVQRAGILPDCAALTAGWDPPRLWTGRGYSDQEWPMLLILFSWISLGEIFSLYPIMFCSIRTVHWGAVAPCRVCLLCWRRSLPTIPTKYRQ